MEYLNRIYDSVLTEHLLENRQMIIDLPFADINCFDYTKPIVVPARTLLSQLI